MKENILEVLMYLFENHMRDSCNLQLSEELLINELKQAGFGTDEISRAFDWLEGLAKCTSANEKMHYVSESTYRILAPQEQAKLGSRSWGFLLFLEQAGILDSYCREIVIDRLMALDPELVDLTQVKWVTLMVLFNQPNAKNALNEMEKLVLDDSLGTVH